MTLWDWLAIALAAALVLEGVLKGAIRLAMGLLGLLLGFLWAGRVAPSLADFLGFLPSALRGPVSAFAGFVVIVLLFVMVGVFLSRLVKVAGLDLPNRLLGVALGLAVAAYLAGGLQQYARSRSPRLEASLDRSPIFSLLARGALLLQEMLPEVRPAPMPAPDRGPGDLA